ncbi:major facilitator superfamily domain-containing protein [Diplogelasinospora grovesii]|uniref:Major facilitator superfamily domain-containing protein n=1 Tax=Diplogelasinospora grovesii TaxID=303347 RepID=A0AAN6SA02_9PEZI|nr:major facilitator superfamily domain-containing protein [Diplogelasinospora grovesii]
MSSWSGQAKVEGSTETMRMALLTFVSVGITFTWGVEMTYCTPYLLSLGLTKGQTSMVWIAGPLSGLIVQPIIGVVADESKSKWGRRRPIIVIGSVVVACSLLTLGYTKEIVAYFISDRRVAKIFTIIVAVFSLYSVDFAINAVMSCSRSLVVDTLPIQKQQTGAAWASRMGSLGHIIGYGMGAVDLSKLFGTAFGDTQFKQLTVIAALGILACSSITCWAVTERVLISVRHHPRRAQTGRFKVVRQIWSTLLTLPPRIRAICWAVFWSWIGWFPFLIYSSTWVGETYFRFDVPEDAKGTKDALGDMGRIGSTALTVYSLVTFISAWILPPLIQAPEDDSFTPRPPASIARWVEALNKRKPDLLTAWIASHLIFAAAMVLTPFAASFRFATALVALCGLPWTVAMWAPTTFLGIEVNKLSAPGASSYRPVSDGNSNMIEMRETSSSPRLEQGSDEPGSSSSSSSHHSAGGELSGVYFGILNIYTTLPQFISTFISTLVFASLEPGKSPELATDAHPSEHHGTDGPNAIAVCMVIGAFSALAAAWATRRLKYI